MDKNSTTIYFAVQKKLGISGNEYRVLDFVSEVMGDRRDVGYSFRNVPGSLIMDQLRMSKGTVGRVINSLVEKKLLQRGVLVHGAQILPTVLWYKTIEPYMEKEEEENGQSNSETERH